MATLRLIHRLLQGSLVALLCTAAALSQAQVIQKTRVGVGEGVSRYEAVTEALTEAAGRAFGLRLDTQKITSLEHTASSSASEDKVSLVERVNLAVTASVKTPDNRPILSYEVLSAEPLRANRWRAKVRIKYAAYQAMGEPSARRTMVVVALGGPGDLTFAEQVQQALVATRRFDVITRGVTEVFEQEKAFLRSGDAAPGEVARLANVKGADYLFLVEVRDRDVATQTERVQLTGETMSQSTASARLRAQVIEMASREVKWVKTLDIAQVYEGVVSSSQLSDRVLQPHAKALVDAMVEAIYPIRVIKSSAGRLLINRGGDSVQMGDAFDVFRLGSPLKDPQSGESLGREERWVGTAVAVSVKPKYAELALQSGEIGSSAKSLLVRARATQAAAAVESVASPASSDPNRARNQYLLAR